MLNTAKNPVFTKLTFIYDLTNMSLMKQMVKICFSWNNFDTCFHQTCQIFITLSLSKNFRCLGPILLVSEPTPFKVHIGVTVCLCSLFPCQNFWIPGRILMVLGITVSPPEVVPQIRLDCLSQRSRSLISTFHLHIQIYEIVFDEKI